MDEKFLSGMRRRYFLARHVYYCAIEDHFIVLDLRRNKYFFPDEREKRVFRLLSKNNDIVGATEAQDLGASIKALTEKGLLVDDPKQGRRDVAIPLVPATMDMNGYPFDGIPKIRVGHVYQCSKAFFFTKLALKFNSMARVMDKITKRKSRQLAKNQTTASLAKIQELVEIFCILNVLFYSSWDKGLFDSLVLVNFLASYGIYPDVVCGVKMDPFMTHAWVQDGTISYNCPVSHAEIFKPIMVA